MPKKNSNYRERREKLLNFMIQTGSWTISPAIIRKMAESYEVSERQIYKDLKEVIKSFPAPEISKIAIKFLISFEKALHETHLLMNNPETEVKIKGIKLFFYGANSYTKFLESYGYKDKLINKSDVAPTIFNIITKSNEEIKAELKAKFGMTKHKSTYKDVEEEANKN